MSWKPFFCIAFLTTAFVANPNVALAYKDFGNTFQWKQQLFIRQPIVPGPITWRDNDFEISELFFKGDDRIIAMSVDKSTDTAYMIAQARPGTPAKLVICGKGAPKVIAFPEDYDTWERRNWLVASDGQCVLVSAKTKAYLLEGEKWLEKELVCTESAEFLKGPPQSVTLSKGVLYFNYWGEEFGSGVLSCSLKDQKWCIEDTRFTRKTGQGFGDKMFDSYQRDMIDSHVRDYVFDGEIWGLAEQEVLHKVDDKWVSVAALPDSVAEEICSIWRDNSGTVFASTGVGNIYRLENDTLHCLETQALVEFLAKKREDAEKAREANPDAPALLMATRLLAVTDNYILLSDSYASLLAFDLKRHKVLECVSSDRKILVSDLAKLQ